MAKHPIGTGRSTKASHTKAPDEKGRVAEDSEGLLAVAPSTALSIDLKDTAALHKEVVSEHRQVALEEGGFGAPSSRSRGGWIRSTV